ncbi:hypothetical protein C8F01DRAFT_1364971 [Mycena amicta]|nr:hypothetical protein C8F01DRAFT_1364971 [Mycena amicta]
MSPTAELRAQIASLSLDIALQQRNLDEMHARLAQLQKELNAVPYPVLTLPTELSTEIFIRCLPPYEDDDYVGNVLDGKCAPLVLTWVCKRWRDIVLSTPALWRTFSIWHGYDKPTSSEILEISRLWLGRAGRRQLSLSITSAYSRYIPEGFPSIWKMVEEAARCLRYLRIQFSSWEHFPDLDIYRPDFPELEQLSLILDPEYSHERSPLASLRAIGTFLHCPLLNRLFLGGGVPASFLLLPYHQITHLEADDLSAELCVESLRLLPNLTSCILRWDLLKPDDDDDDDEPEHLVHANLLSLSITTISTREEPDEPDTLLLLQSLTLPSLNTLKISFSYGFTGTASVLGSFLARSSPPLQQLSVVPFGYMDDQTSVHLALSPNLRVLPLTTLHIANPSKDFLSSFFSLLAHNGRLLPQLQRVEFTDCDPHSVWTIVEQSTQSVRARNELKGCASIHSLRLVFHHPSLLFSDVVRWIRRDSFTKEVFSFIQQLKERGTDIYIGTKTESMVEEGGASDAANVCA